MFKDFWKLWGLGQPAQELKCASLEAEWCGRRRCLVALMSAVTAWWTERAAAIRREATWHIREPLDLLFGLYFTTVGPCFGGSVHWCYSGIPSEMHSIVCSLVHCRVLMRSRRKTAHAQDLLLVRFCNSCARVTHEPANAAPEFRAHGV